MTRLALHVAAYAALAGVLGVLTGVVIDRARYSAWRREKGRGI